MEPTSALAVLAALVAAGTPAVMKGLDFVKFLTNRDWNAAITQASAWLIGLSVAFALKASDLDVGIDELNVWTIVLGGFVLGSSASVTIDAFKSIDNSQSAAKPSLIPVTPDDSELPPSSWPSAGNA